jgi:hypothetical protein
MFMKFTRDGFLEKTPVVYCLSIPNNVLRRQIFIHKQNNDDNGTKCYQLVIVGLPLKTVMSYGKCRMFLAAGTICK